MKTPYELFADEGILSSGWKDIVQPLVDECKEKGYQITQIKEKYGTLRFNVVGADSGFWDKIEEAEKQSAHICYQCGKLGTTWFLGWYQTLCLDHALENYGKDMVEIHIFDRFKKENYYE